MQFIREILAVPKYTTPSDIQKDAFKNSLIYVTRMCSMCAMLLQMYSIL